MNQNTNFPSGIICEIEGHSVHFDFSDHFLTRQSQRAVSHDMIQAVIEYGQAFFKQGLIFYVLGSKPTSRQKRANKDLSPFKNIVLLVSKETNQIITCYRNSNPFKYIKKKPKRNNS